jgi:hypothetical protein
MNRTILITFLPFFFVACGGSSGGGDPLTSNVSESFEYACTIEVNEFAGCWLTTQCASSGSSFSSKIIFEAEAGTIVRKSALFQNSSCTGQPDIETMINAELTYSYDSTVISSEGLDTDMYQISTGYTLVSIEQNLMCFSEDFYTVSSTHSLNFDSKENVSLTVDFVNCLERI